MRPVLLAALLLSAPAAPVFAAEVSLTVGEAVIDADGTPIAVKAINGQVPGPTLRFREGEEAVIRVTNALDEPTALHWHGILLPGGMDGVPGLNGFPGIAPGETFTYRFTLRQSGTYWYHSHAGFQEQEGVYAPLIVEPASPGPIQVDRDYVVMLSDLTPESGAEILRTLKADPGAYNTGKRTLGDFARDAGRDGVGAALDDRLAWGAMRMDPTDLADVGGYTFLVNGRTPAQNETLLFRKGERVRLRFINGAAMSYFDVRIPGLKMIVVAADGPAVQPVPVDEFRIAVAETYDVIVTPDEDRAYTILAEPLDRSGYARATLAPREGMEGEIPPLRPRTVLTMADMGAAHAGMDHAEMGHAQDHAAHGAHPAAPQTGWAAAGTPEGARALRYDDLKALEPNRDGRPPSREIVIRLTGNMERYVWSLNGKSGADAEPVPFSYGERVKIVFVNETMMAHPMHLHGMFVELDNGADGHLPRKHVVSVPPGRSASVLLTADEPGEWAFHCHLLMHMGSGMMTKAVVARLAADAPR